MSAPKAPPPAPERQPMKLPDQANAGNLADDIAKRRRAMSMTAMTGALGLTSGPATTSALGG